MQEVQEHASRIAFNPRRGPFLLIPYNAQDGDSAQQGLVNLYDRIKDEGLHKVIFHEHPNMTLLEFLNFMSGPRTFLQVLAICEGDRVVDICGLSWLADIQSCDSGRLVKGIGSFVFFEEYQKPAYTDGFRDLVLTYWFDVLKISIVAGLTPSRNRAAVLFAKRIGFREVVRFPGYTTYDGDIDDAVISMMTREDYDRTVIYGKPVI